MGKIQKATRLPKDQADRVEEYAERHEITEADALRRLIRVGLNEEEKPVSDGSGTIRDALTTTFGVMFAIAAVSWAISFTATVPTAAALAVSYAAFTVDIAAGAILYTSLPEKADLILHSGVNRAGQMTRLLRGGEA